MSDGKTLSQIYAQQGGSADISSDDLLYIVDKNNGNSISKAMTVAQFLTYVGTNIDFSNRLAGPNTLGVVKIGTGITISNDGTISIVPAKNTSDLGTYNNFTSLATAKPNPVHADTVIVAGKRYLCVYPDNATYENKWVKINDVEIDNTSITKNASDQIQAVGIIDVGGVLHRVWTGTKEQYDANKTQIETNYPHCICIIPEVDVPVSAASNP